MKNEESKYIFYEDFLKERKAKEISLEEIADKIKINPRYLEAIEKGNFDILPNVYVRLFIRAYSNYLNLNSSDMLSHYEKHTNIKQSKFSFNIKTKIISDNKASLKSSDIKSTISDENRIKKFYYTPKNIISIVLTFFTILCLYLLISFLSKEQLNEIQNNHSLEPLQKNISDNSLLTESNFLKDNFIKSVTKKLKYKIKSPYIFEIISNNKTKIKLSYKDKNGKEIILCNKIVPKGTLHSYHIENIIFFELWADNDVTITIKNESDLSEIYSISKYLKKDGNLVKGYYNLSNNELVVDYYKH